MRAKILLPLLILVLGATILLLETPQAFTQGFPSKKSGKGGYKYDPNVLFDKLAQGKEYVVIAEIRDPDRRNELSVFAKKVGISSDRITRDQYLKFFEMRDDIRAGLKFDKLAQDNSSVVISQVRDPDRKDELMVFAKKAGISGDKITREQYLKFMEMRDEIKAGLNFDKMAQQRGFFVISEIRDPDRKQEMTLFARKSGITNDKIARDQYFKFLEMRDEIREELRGGRLSKGGFGGPPNGGPPSGTNSPAGVKKVNGSGNSSDKANSGIDVITIEGSTRTETWRAGKLPPGLPDWFTALDKNKDGQVALYEWRSAGKADSEFLRMDLNDDQLLTADEYFRFQRQMAAAAKAGNGK